MTIMNIYVAKINVLRKYKRIIKHKIIHKKIHNANKNVIICDEKSNRKKLKLTNFDFLCLEKKICFLFFLPFLSSI